MSRVRGGEVVGPRCACGRPVLGICVGMQVLFDPGVEHGSSTEGLGVLPGVVARLEAPVVPHMGWNTVEAPAGSRCSTASSDAALLLRALLRRAADASRARRRDLGRRTAGPFVAAVERGPAVGHPVPPREVRRRRARRCSPTGCATL